MVGLLLALLIGEAGADDARVIPPPDLAAAEAVPFGDVKAKRRVQPAFPEAAKPAGVGATCGVRFYIDELGKPYHMRVGGCPDEFVVSAALSAARWTFYPSRDDQARPRKATFELTLVYLLVGAEEEVRPAQEGVGTEVAMLAGEQGQVLALYGGGLRAVRQEIPLIPAETGEGSRACRVRIGLDAGGAARSVDAGECDPALRDASIEAARGWRFAAATEGQPLPEALDLAFLFPGAR